MESKRFNHPSYGKLQILKTTGRMNLFDSHITNSGCITIKIKSAEIDRHNSTNWIHGKKELIEVRLSPLQWAEAMSTAMNTEGVPCTIARFENQSIEGPPVIDVNSEFEESLSNDMRGKLSSVMEARRELRNIINTKGSVSKKSLSNVMQNLESGLRHFESNLKFAQNCFKKESDKAVLEAKITIKHYVDSTIQKLGVKALRDMGDIKAIGIRGE